jgi:hypothetical protein
MFFFKYFYILFVVDEQKTSLVCSTQGGKILVYTPKSAFEQETGTDSDLGTEINTFSINGKVTGIATGRLDNTVNYDILAIGLETSVRAYNINQNSDVYFVNVCFFSNFSGCFSF